MVDLSNSSDQEQIDAVKAWWKDNGMSIVLGVVIGVGGLFGWKYWQEYTIEKKAQASLGFEAAQGDLQKTQAYIKDNKETVYAADLALSEAASLALKGEYKSAIDLLLPVANSSSIYSLQAKINLAKVYVADKQASKALDLLATEQDYGSFSAQHQWALGDALAASGQKEKAKVAYKSALLGFADSQSLSSVLQLKINNL